MNSETSPEPSGGETLDARSSQPVSQPEEQSSSVFLVCGCGHQQAVEIEKANYIAWRCEACRRENTALTVEVEKKTKRDPDPEGVPNRGTWYPGLIGLNYQDKNYQGNYRDQHGWE